METKDDHFRLGGKEGKMKGPEVTLTLADLPEIVIGDILGRLPIKDAGRTSVLCRSWRHRWRSMLDLDLSDVSDPAVISQVLLLHHGPLHSFKARPQLSDCTPILPCWLSALSHRSYSTLRSLFLATRSCGSLNSIASYFPNLTHLSLEFCSFTLSPSSFKGFPNLRSLDIRQDYSCSPHLPFLISTCPLLEELILIHLHHGWDHGLDIVCPNLRRLTIAYPRICRLSISSAPLIETAVISSISDSNFHLMSALGAIASVRNLELGDSVLGSWANDLKRGEGYVPVRIPISLDHLRSLSLTVHLESQASLVPCLLRSCPNLDNLEIRRGWCDLEPLHHIGEGFWEAQEPISMLDRLETVKMTRMEGIKHELELIQFLLARTIKLKTMMISFDSCSRNEVTAMMKIWEFPTASTEAQIRLIACQKGGDSDDENLGVSDGFN